MTESEKIGQTLYNKIVKQAPYLKEDIAIYAIHLEAQFLRKYEKPENEQLRESINEVKRELEQLRQLLRDKHDTIVGNTVQLQTASDNINRLQTERDEMVQQVMNAWEILVDIDHPKIDQVFTALGFNPDGSICKPLNV